MEGMAIRRNQGAQYLMRVCDDFETKKVKYLRDLSSEATKGKRISQMLLEIDDILRCGYINNNYQEFTPEKLKEDCVDRNLPSNGGKIAYRIILRAIQLPNLTSYFNKQRIP